PLGAGLKGGGATGTPPGPVSPPGGGSPVKSGGGGGHSCGAIGLEGLLMFGLRELLRRRRLALVALALMSCTISGASSAMPQATNWTQKGGSLSADVQGYAYNPSIAVGSNGSLYAV